MNRKCSTEPPQSSKTEEKEEEDIITDKTDLVEEKAHIIGFPFTKTAESQVATALSNQHVLAFPTETFYGLGGNAFSKSLVERVYRIKKRPLTKPLLVLITPEWLPRLCQWNDSRIYDLMSKDEFPKNHSRGRRTSVWFLPEIEDWCKQVAGVC